MLLASTFCENRTMRLLNHWKAILILAALLLTLTGLALSGSHSAQAFSPHRPPGAASRANPSGERSSGPTLQVSKHSARDSEFALYRNLQYGVSFRYPRNYALVEGTDTDDLTLLRYQEELAAGQQPGAVTLATVIIPEDAYPNTSFRSGALEFIVLPGTTLEACRLSPRSEGNGITGTLALQGIPFDWRLSREVADDTYVESAAYAGFSRGHCYQFVLEIVASSRLAPGSAVQPRDLAKILRRLEKIVLSFQFPCGEGERKRHP